MEPIRVVRGGVFVPEWGNAGRAEADQIKIRYTLLTVEQEQTVVGKVRRAIRDIEDEQDRIEEFVLQQWVERAIAMIDGVENLSVDDGNEVVEIRTGKDLFTDPGLTQLAFETVNHFRDLTAVDKKKSQSASSSGKKESTPSASDRKSETVG